MLELEENKKELMHFKNQIQNLSDSLWHCKNGKRNKRIRKSNYGRWILEW